MVYRSFKDWVDAEVLPLRQRHPRWLRLDGQTSGGNRTVVGKFEHMARVWVVHADTRFDPILRAYGAIGSGYASNPFTIQRAKVRDCLELLPTLKVQGQPKHFYVYG